MLTIKAILEATQAFSHPPKILTFDSPQSMAVACALIHWTNYECSLYAKKTYKELDLSQRKLPGLSSPTKRNLLESQVRTVLHAVNRYNDAAYTKSGTGEYISSDAVKMRAIPEFQKAVEMCDTILGKDNVDIGLHSLRRDLLRDNTYDLGTYRSAEYEDGHSPSQFSGTSVNSYWIVSYKSLILIVNPPTQAHVDKDNLLHNPNGPAVEYTDGYQIWAWRGYALPKQYILKPSTYPFDRDGSTGVEGLYWIESYKLFYALAELVGYSYFYKYARKEVLDEDYDRKKKHRKLVTLNWANFHGHITLLVLGEGKDRAYLKMPDDIETCAQAVAWSFGKIVREYQPVVET